jgi:tetratricopeptide (TPR) repeat protein
MCWSCPSMKPIAIFSALTLAVAAETPEAPLRDLLRDGLYAEEVANDPAAATKYYEQILARFEEQRPLAANALFRLAELYRKTERKDEAIALYQRVLAQFPDATPQAALARTRLTTLGIQASAPPQDGPSTPEPVEDEETKEIRRLSDLAKTSPDLLKPEREIPKIAQKGWARATRFLVDRLKGKERLDLLNQALTFAAESGQLSLCQALLDQGADPNQPADGQTLARAVWQDRTEVVKLLLQKGANPNLMPASCRPFDWQQKNNYQPIGGALHAAAFHNNAPLIRLLLDSGANAGLAAPETRMTPLALYLRCSPNMSLEIVTLFLSHGADLKAPAKDGQSLLEYAAASLKDPAILDLLLERGIPIDEKWKAVGFETPNVPLRKTLLERFSFPDWSKDSKIRLVVLRGGTNRFASSQPQPPEPEPEPNAIDELFPVLADKVRNDQPGLLAEHLLGVEENSLRLIRNAPEITLYRKNASGGLDQTKIRFDSAEALPALQWGDILWVASPGYDSSSEGRSWPAQTAWSLRRQVSMRVDVEIGGEKQTLALRGDRLSYDPTQPVYPWSESLSAGYLLGSLAIPWDRSQPFQIYRKSWPQPISMSPGNTEASRFKLKDGDRIVLPALDPESEAAKKARLGEVRLTSPGLWFHRYYNASTSSPAPSLLQAIASAYTISLGKDSLEPFVSPPNPAKIASILLRYPYSGFSVLPHPDLARVRIRRLSEDGSERSISVDLQKAAAACDEMTTSEQARKFDVDLQPGDIVELPVIESSKGKPWSGFSEGEKRLFALALSGRIQFIASQERILRDVQFVMPQVIDTGHGLITVPSKTGTSSLRAPDLYNSAQYEDYKVALTRNGEDHMTYLSSILVRDGDLIDVTRQPNGAVPRQPMIQPRPLRQRVVPPAQHPEP